MEVIDLCFCKRSAGGPGIQIHFAADDNDTWALVRQKGCGQIDPVCDKSAGNVLRNGFGKRKRSCSGIQENKLFWLNHPRSGLRNRLFAGGLLCHTRNIRGLQFERSLSVLLLCKDCTAMRSHDFSFFNETVKISADCHISYFETAYQIMNLYLSLVRKKFQNSIKTLVFCYQ